MQPSQKVKEGAGGRWRYQQQLGQCRKHSKNILPKREIEY